jgi:hypothetical protein
MPQYLVAIHHPDGYDGSLEGEAMVRDIDVLNEEMDAAGARFFAGGLSAASSANMAAPPRARAEQFPITSLHRPLHTGS